MRRVWTLVAACAVAACFAASCGKTKSASPDASGQGGQGGQGGAAGLDGGSPDLGAAGTGGPDGSTTPDGKLAGCLDRPGSLPTPPAGALPCELIPPGLVLGQ
jgi:hypothetical protein